MKPCIERRRKCREKQQKTAGYEPFEFCCLPAHTVYFFFYNRKKTYRHVRICQIFWRNLKELRQMDETFLTPVFFLPVTCGIPPFPFEALFDTSECNRNDKKTLPTICQPAYFSCATRGCKRFKGLRTFLNKRFRISFVLHVVHFKIAHIS